MKNIQTLKNELAHVKGLMKGAPAEDRKRLREQTDLIKDRIKRAEEAANVSEMTASGGVATFTTSGPAVGQKPAQHANSYMTQMEMLIGPQEGKTKSRRKGKKKE